MKKLKQLFRLLQINLILARYGLDQLIFTLHLFRPFKFLIYFNPWYWIYNKDQPVGVRLRLALETLGPIFVKFGQSLSTRKDLLSEEIANELAKLQDCVPPFAGELACKILEATYQRPLTQVFAEFDSIPLASASIAQAHVAKLYSGQEVVVKVLRPAIKKKITRDVNLLYMLATLAERYWSEGSRLRPREVVAEFERSLIDELDLLHEAASASQLRRNFLNSHLLYIPVVYWDYCRQNILVTERIYGIPISDIKTLKQHNINLKLLAERGVEIFFTQVFRDCFFHADMHPGNIFVSPHNPENPQYLGVDFGIMGTLSPFDQRYLAENLLAFFNRDYRRVAQLHVESAWVPPDTRINELEAAIRTVCEPIFERPLSEISFGQLLLRLFQTARRFNMEVQPQLLLLQKTLFNVEGLGRQLYPDLDLWSTAKPFLQDWLKQQMGPRALFKKIRQQLPYWLEKLPDVPELIYQNLVDTHTLIRKKDQAHINQQVQKKSPLSSIKLGIGSALLTWGLINIASDLHWLQFFNNAYKNLALTLLGILFLAGAYFKK